VLLLLLLLPAPLLLLSVSMQLASHCRHAAPVSLTSVLLLLPAPLLWLSVSMRLALHVSPTSVLLLQLLLLVPLLLQGLPSSRCTLPLLLLLLPLVLPLLLLRLWAPRWHLLAAVSVVSVRLPCWHCSRLHVGIHGCIGGGCGCTTPKSRNWFRIEIRCT
jgi:hypothetical protein